MTDTQDNAARLMSNEQTTYKVKQHENGRWQWGVVLDASEAWSEPLALDEKTAVGEAEVHAARVLAEYWRSVPLPDGFEQEVTDGYIYLRRRARLGGPSSRFAAAVASKAETL